MEKRIEVFNGKAYEQVFVSPDEDMERPVENSVASRLLLLMDRGV